MEIFHLINVTIAIYFARFVYYAQSMYCVVRKVSFFRKRVFYNSAASSKRETKSVKCHGVYLNRTKWIVGK